MLEYNPIRLTDRVPLPVNRRDHRKLLVVDGQVAITGGVNISRVYLNPADASPVAAFKAADVMYLPWRDTALCIEGPVVAQFQALFTSTWEDQHAYALPPSPPTPDWIRGPTQVLALDGTPDQDRPAICRTLIVAITLAQHSVHLTTGYFSPPPDLRHTLVDADFGRQIEAMFTEDIAASQQINLAKWRARSLGEWITEWRARLVEPFLQERPGPLPATFRHRDPSKGQSPPVTPIFLLSASPGLLPPSRSYPSCRETSCTNSDLRPDPCCGA